MKVEWSPAAQADRQSIFVYLATENGNFVAANRIVDEVEAGVGRLAHFPESGRFGKVSGTRELVVTGTPYIAVYRIRHGVVRVLRLFHHAQRWPKRL